MAVRGRAAQRNVERLVPACVAGDLSPVEEHRRVVVHALEVQRPTVDVGLRRPGGEDRLVPGEAGPAVEGVVPDPDGGPSGGVG